MAALQDYLVRNGLDKCKVSAFFFSFEFTGEEKHKDAAWNLFVDIGSRIATQALPDDVGDEQRALDSLYEFFLNSRETLRTDGRISRRLSLTVFFMLNKVLRPFLANWHQRSLAGELKKPEGCQAFRNDLKALQPELRACAITLADAAGVDFEVAEELL